MEAYIKIWLICIMNTFGVFSILDFIFQFSGFFVFVFNDTATTEIYTLSLHDALPISPVPEEPVSLKKVGSPLDKLIV